MIQWKYNFLLIKNLNYKRGNSIVDVIACLLNKCKKKIHIHKWDKKNLKKKKIIISDSSICKFMWIEIVI
jgi:hypothetical protein